MQGQCFILAMLFVLTEKRDGAALRQFLHPVMGHSEPAQSSQMESGAELSICNCFMSTRNMLQNTSTQKEQMFSSF